MANPRRFVALTTLLAVGLFVLAAVLPMSRGRPMNVAFLGAGVAFLGFGFVLLSSSAAKSSDHERTGDQEARTED